MRPPENQGHAISAHVVGVYIEANLAIETILEIRPLIPRPLGGRN